MSSIDWRSPAIRMVEWFNGRIKSYCSKPDSTAGLTWRRHVAFHTSTDEQPCKGLAHAASVYNAELLRKNLLPFIAKMQQKARALTGVHPEKEVTVKAGVPLQVLGQSTWSDKVGNSWVSGGCGPFTQRFTPEAGHKYMVLFEFAGGSCGQLVQDISDTTAPVPVELDPLECKVPGLFD